MMASPFVGPVSAIQVGSCFVEQYYYILERNPKLVYQFYTDASTMLRIDGDRNEVASAMLQIHSLVMSLNFSGIEIKTTHSLDSWSGGVLVTVTGYVQITSFSGRRKFVETFFLAPQEKGYFVLNDVFHLLDEEQIPPHPMSMLTSSTFESPLIASNPLSERDYILGGELKAREYIVSPHVEENNMVENYSKPESQQVLEADNRVAEETDAEDSSASYPVAGNNTRDVASVAAQEPVGEVPKQTYASIASSNKSVPVSSEWHSAQSHQQSLPEPAIAHDKHGVETVEETATPEEEGEGRSVYVRNLPSTVSASDIELEFNSFGRIRPEGVVVRNRKDLGICYAFVEFEDVLGVQSAVNASPIQFAGRQVHIEERRANTNAPRGGRRGRGRGRFQSEAPRGRISGRNFGRGSWQDGERDYNNRLRVDVRGPRQDRGILGNHISKTSSHHSEDAA
ncbi:nuclear transport factor 2-like isoform X2 [Aristolochia californica]|uniref:nuclear transport factor 2-like isoform X2 n=1 Tax=Aristolochia californica TaxID=171875 RepID=UPI0035E251EF